MIKTYNGAIVLRHEDNLVLTDIQHKYDQDFHLYDLENGLEYLINMNDIYNEGVDLSFLLLKEYKKYAYEIRENKFILI